MIDQKILDSLYKSNEQQLKEFLEPIPQQISPIVTQKDVTNKYMIRYFVRQVNDQLYVVEVNKQQYESFKTNPRFITVKIKWKIIGKKETTVLSSGAKIYGVDDQNRIEVETADLTFGGLRSYITSYLEYWFSEE
jgi:hypothetical protein